LTVFPNKVVIFSSAGRQIRWINPNYANPNRKPLGHTFFNEEIQVDKWQYCFDRITQAPGFSDILG